MNMESFRLPRLVESDPRGAALYERLVEHAQPIRDGSEISVAVARFDGLQNALLSAHRAGHVVRGLEAAEQTLAAEAHGLRLADESSGLTRGRRVLAIRLDVDATSLGAPLFGAGRTTRLLMIQHKESVAAILFAIGESS